MIRISAEIKKEDIQNLMKTFSGQLMRKAIRSGLDKTGTWGKNYLADDVSSNYNLTSARVKKAIKVKRTTMSNLETSLNITGKRLSILDDFKAWQDAIGIKAHVRRNTLTVTPHAFINRVRVSGKRVIMMRVGKERYPTTGKPGVGPSVPILVDRLSNRKKRDADLQNHLYKELEAQILKRTMQAGATPLIE
jgi:hypothetical protein